MMGFEAVEEGIAGAGLVLKNLTVEPAAGGLCRSRALRQRDTPQMVKIDANLRKKVPEMNAAYDEHNQVFLASGVNDFYAVVHKFPVTKFEDLKGVKMGSSGSLGQWLRGTGAVTVNSSMNQSFTNIKNGVYEGYPLSEILSFVYKTWSAAPYYTKVDFAPSIIRRSASTKMSGRACPGHVQQIIREESAKWAGYQNAIDVKEAEEIHRHHEEKGPEGQHPAAGQSGRNGRTPCRILPRNGQPDRTSAGFPDPNCSKPIWMKYGQRI